MERRDPTAALPGPLLVEAGGILKRFGATEVLRGVDLSLRGGEAHALDRHHCFGIDRCMFAGNFPVDKLFSSHDDLFETSKAITRDFPAADRRKLFHDDAERFYRT